MDLHRLTRLSLFTAAMLILYMAELRLPSPLPVPGVKLGLPNLVLLTAMYRFRPSEVLLMAAIRILCGALFAGQLTILFYSVSGVLVSLSLLLPLIQFLPDKWLPFTGMSASVLHMAGQLCAAAFMTGTSAILLWAPYLITTSLVTGYLTGLGARLFLSQPVTLTLLPPMYARAVH